MRLLLVLAIVWLVGTCSSPLPESPVAFAWTTLFSLMTLLTSGRVE